MTIFSKIIGNTKAIWYQLREQEHIWQQPVSFNIKSKKTKKIAPSTSTSDEDDGSNDEIYRLFKVILDPDDEKLWNL